jgi:TPR repeat protein
VGSQELVPTTLPDLRELVPTALPEIGRPELNPRDRPVRLMALGGLVSVVAGLMVTLGGHNSEPSTVANERDKPLSTSRLSALVACHSGQADSSAPHLVVGTASSTLRSGEPAPLGVTVDRAADGAQLVIGGFASGSLFSVGRSASQNAWSAPASQIEAATVRPPRGFVGAMDMAVSLVLADGSVADRQSLHFEWLPPTSALRSSGSSVSSIDTNELKALLVHGNALEAIGDLAAARLVFQRAAEAGSARGAFMLAETYDPIALEKLGEVGLASDVVVARNWYGKAKDLGSEEAPVRLQGLAHLSD